MPVYSRVIVRQPDTLRPAADGEMGILSFVTPMMTGMPLLSIMTDDLAMEAITQYTDGQSAAVAAVLAGNDMLCCTDFTTQIPAVIDAVNAGTISQERIDQSVLRILASKIELGIIA